jgi:DNA-binding MarR family transcriptional regulator
VSKDTQGSYRTQPDSIFTASEARHQSGYTAIPLGIARRHGAVAQTLGRLLEIFRQDGRTTKRTQTHLAKWCGCSVSTFRRHCRVLTAEGLIEIITRPHDTSILRLKVSEAAIHGATHTLPLVNYSVKLPWRARLVLAYVIFRAELGPGHNTATDGVKAIARELGMDPQGVRQALNQLDLADLLVREESGDGDPARLRIVRPPNKGEVIVAAPPKEGRLSWKDPRGYRGREGEVIVTDRSISGYHYKETISDVASKKALLTNVKTDDLQDQGRLAGLYMKATRIGAVEDKGEAGFHRFSVLAAHCLAVGKNPGALFASNLANDRFYGTADQDQAVGKPAPRRRPPGDPDAELAADMEQARRAAMAVLGTG